MLKNNSGKLFRLKLDHNLGYGFAELYDFTDVTSDYGLLVYVYDRVDANEENEYQHSAIRASGIALGPLRMVKFPNTYGPDAWKEIARSSDLMIHELPDTKQLRGYESQDENWDKLGDWFRVSNHGNRTAESQKYSKIRNLETDMPHTIATVATKLSMKKILDAGERVSEYYDFTKEDFKISFIEVINTYYPLDQMKSLLKQLG